MARPSEGQISQALDLPHGRARFLPIQRQTMAHTFSGRRSGRTSRTRPYTRSIIEQLESRCMLATITVNTVADDNARDDFLSLREAILLANGGLSYSAATQAEKAQITEGTPGADHPDTIAFNIPGSGLHTSWWGITSGQIGPGR